ncbi:phosphoglycerate mutase [Cytophagales bacterium WSM2-2]|nr:phosphoglycerate mutase [Cytophagales bacterium WSM2-2]
MRSYLILFLILTGINLQGQDQLTTFILVRHAEKVSDGSKDPDLTPEGMIRAENLTKLFQNTTISGVYSTPFNRTRKTVASLAQSKSLTVQDYEPAKNEAIEKIWNNNLGKTVLISGHSNTIPRIANYLTGTDKFKDFADSDYGNILVITVIQKNKTGSVTWLRY